jgi:7-keto-8-aminopelargonate synthetase-like enzyme
MSGYAPAEIIPFIDRSIRSATAAGVMMNTADDAAYEGRFVELKGARLLNFGGCSYLGLDQRDELKEGAIDAVRRYGTQFSVSRAYLQSPLYERLESALDRMTGGHAIVAASTTLAHISAIPVLVRPGDAVLLDRYAHASVHTAVGLLDAVPVALVAHSDLAAIEAEVTRLEESYRKVFYLIDGLYSMHGDFAPFAALAGLLDRHPQLHLYVDDAHSTSWLGTHGRGAALELLPDRSRVFVALSLNKAFSAAGGALICPDPEMRGLVRRCGGPMLFSGPIPPPMLGAAVASADLHLGPGLADLQASLLDRIDLVRTLSRELGIRYVNADRSPIFFAPCGTLKALFPVVQALLGRGMFVCPGGFPAVAKNQSGVRFTVSTANTMDDIRLFLEALADELPRCGIARPAGVTRRVSSDRPR